MPMHLNGYSDLTLSQAALYYWCQWFKDGREEVKDLPRSGRPSTSTNKENVKEIVLKIRYSSVREFGCLKIHTRFEFNICALKSCQAKIKKKYSVTTDNSGLLKWVAIFYCCAIFST